MRVKNGLLLIVAMLSQYALAADQPVHLLDTGSTASGPVAPSAMNERILDAAKEYDAYAPVPRVALFDIAYPLDKKEYAALGGYGVMLVTVITQEKDEIPPKRVYAVVDGSIVELHLFTSVFEKQERNAEINKVFGQYRWDGLYYYPVYLTERAQKLVMDFGSNRDGFVLGKFGEADKSVLSFLGSDISQPKVSQPPEKGLIKLISREYPGFLAKNNNEGK